MRNSFEEAVRELCLRYPQYSPEAYDFVRTGLDYASEHYCKDDKAAHLSAEQLYAGACSYALSEYGPLAAKVLSFWGLHSNRDFGAVVYHLIEVGVFGKQKGDKQEEFDTLPPLEAVLNAPYNGDLDDEEYNENDDDF
ncbi:MAG: hypothetical protein E7031_01625 [Akkermansiaceae bacterium]|nr:hypothetical protein [Akkermansiaceae bacterium]